MHLIVVIIKRICDSIFASYLFTCHPISEPQEKEKVRGMWCGLSEGLHTNVSMPFQGSLTLLERVFVNVNKCA